MSDVISETATKTSGGGLSDAPLFAQLFETSAVALPEGLQPREATRIPHVRIDAFCESSDVAAVVRNAAADRLMSRTHVAVHDGGIVAAAAHYRKEPSPQLIVIETGSTPEAFLLELEKLSEVCDAGTKVMAIGHANDVSFYRELTKRGVSDYLLAPIDPGSLIAAVSGIYSEHASGKLGRVLTFVGVKGGVGSSTIAHNVGWTIARELVSDVVLADMDLAFGTASLDFKLDAGQGVEEAIADATRLDGVLLDRLLAKCSDHLSLLRAPGTLDKCYDLGENAVDPLIEVAQASVPFLLLDMPHVWNAWARKVLVNADDIIITAVPDLPNLRNAKSMISFLRQARPQDPPPKLILNQVGMPKRPEIKPADFAKAVQLDLLACIPFDSHLFGKASNEGQMVAEISANAPASRIFSEIVSALSPHPAQGKQQFNIGSLMKRMKLSFKNA